MYAKKIKTRSAQPGFVYIAVIENTSEMEDNTGMCLACGAENGPLEPDARKYKCQSCGGYQVYGLQELLLMGRLKIGGKAMEVEIYELKPDPGGEVCDLCFGRPVTWQYPCASFVGPTAENGNQAWIQKSVGAWAACDACHDLIESNQREELAERSYNAANAPEGWDEIKRLIPKRELIGHFRVLHDQFFFHRQGLAVPVRAAA